MDRLREQSVYEQGFARVAAVSVPVHLGDPDANAKQIIGAARKCHDDGASLAVFPELSITGYSIDDLVTQRPLLEGAIAAIDTVAAASTELNPVLIVGAPLVFEDSLYNCAVVIHHGRVIGIQPKQHLPSYREFYEKRHYSVPSFSGPNFAAIGMETEWIVWDQGLRRAARDSASVTSSASIPFGAFQIEATDVPGLRVAMDVCEDAWVPVSPSALEALRGATVIVNLSASPVTIGRARRRRQLVQGLSSSLLCAYVYTAAGFGESSNDLAWDGQTLIYENGLELASGPRFAREPVITTADVDLQLIAHERLVQNSFADNAHRFETASPPVVRVLLHPEETASPVRVLRRPIARFPFVPDQQSERDSDCYEAFNIQTSALVRRMVSIGSPKLVIGVSGGLDSTQALLVCVKAMDTLGRPRADVLAYTMPGFGTSTTTRQNAEALCRALGVTFQELDIRPTAELMLKTIGHPVSRGLPEYDVTFENVQAGLRTDYLFRLAGQQGGIVVGTGDMSELALGWCTYGVGDQMSHYGVNAGLPKTVIQHLIRWVSTNEDFAGDTHDLLDSILGTEISPELIPGGKEGETQSTQAQIGPYELQDFTLYWILKGGFGPKRIAYLQSIVWGDKYDDHEILRWLELFFKRFFASQYKRTAVPNSPKIMAAGSLSPRGDWRMPSDATAKQWLSEVAAVRALVENEGDQ